jgi:hypothetical protein
MTTVKSQLARNDADLVQVGITRDGRSVVTAEEANLAMAVVGQVQPWMPEMVDEGVWNVIMDGEIVERLELDGFLALDVDGFEVTAEMP